MHVNGIINSLHVSKFQRNIFVLLENARVGGYLKHKIEYELRKIRERKKRNYFIFKTKTIIKTTSVAIGFWF